jgi:hypothetical protein
LRVKRERNQQIALSLAFAAALKKVKISSQIELCSSKKKILWKWQLSSVMGGFFLPVFSTVRVAQVIYVH